MKRVILGWMIGNAVANSQSANQYNDTPYYTEPIQKDDIVYEYWPHFDNDEPTIGLAYQLYEENQVCHLAKNGGCTCYLEFEGDVKRYMRKNPEIYFDKI